MRAAGPPQGSRPPRGGATRSGAGGEHTRRSSTASLVRSAAPFAPLTWTFDGALRDCLADIEDTLRRAIPQLGDVGGIAVALDVSLPALDARLKQGDVLQPAWSGFVERLTQRYGLPCPPRIRHRAEPGPLATLIIVYRS